jgi:hypothetical protein
LRDLARGRPAGLPSSASEPSGRTENASAVSPGAALATPAGNAKIGTLRDAVCGAAASLRNHAYGTAWPAALRTRTSRRSG